MPDSTDAHKPGRHNADVSTVTPSPRDGNEPVPTRLTAPGDTARLATFAALFGQSPVGLGIFDAECRYVLINEALQAIIGLPVSQVVGRRVEEVLGPLGLRVATNLRTVMASGSPMVNQEFVGSTYAFEGQPRAFLASYFRLADDEGRLLGAASLVNDVTDQRRTREELAAANERLSLLTRVSGALASCLVEQDALMSFAQLVVPAFADHCLVDLLDETGLVQRAALVHADGLAPDQEAWARPGQVVTYPSIHPVVRAINTAKVVFDKVPENPDFRRLAPTPESAELARRLGIRSAMTAPLVARGDVIGAVSFVTSASGRVFNDVDVEMGEELASRVAIALDNARLYAREQRIALTLQRSLLPETLPETPSLETAAVYQPAAHDGTVGGDWYDVIPLPCGRVGLVMGDVMGRGVPAAALMGQLRAAVRAYAAQDLPPADLLGHLDGLVRGLADDVLVTCVYAVYDPVEESLCLANAGHVPPLVLTADGAQRVESDGVVLGAGHGSYEQVEVDFGPGTVLALYTDGLVERRADDIDSRIDELVDVMRAGDGALDAVCRRLVALTGDSPDVDDVAIMLVRPHPHIRPRVARLDLVPHAAKVRDIRRFATEVLGGWGEPRHVSDPVELIVSELVTNVIRHASGHEASVRLERHADRIVVAVVDPDARPPRVTRAALDDEGGRGLHLVDAVADRWGTRTIPSGGKIVWCELLAPPA